MHTIQQIGALLMTMAAMLPAHASPADTVFTPYAEEGERFVQYAFGHEKTRDGGSEQAHALGLGWSPTARWFTSVYAGWYREPGESLSLYAYSRVNHLNLTPQGSTPAGIGLYLEIERPRERSEGYEITWGPTFQFDAASVLVNANLWLQKSVRAEAAEPAALIYQWQAKRLWRTHLELGVQGLGSVGPWQHWSPTNEQEHNFGPALFAKLPLGSGHTLNVDTALLAGLTTASPRFTFRARAQYEF